MCTPLEVNTGISVGKEIMTFGAAHADIIEAIDADFWGCYICDLDGRCVEILYDLRSKDPSEYEEMNKKRNEITMNVDKMLKRCCENNLSIHVVLGHKDFLNYYYYPTADGTFERIEVTFVVKD